MKSRKTIVDDFIELFGEIPNNKWTAENIQKAIDSYGKRFVYTWLALLIMGKTADYLPIPPSLKILGKKETLKRLKNVVI